MEDIKKFSCYPAYVDDIQKLSCYHLGNIRKISRYRSSGMFIRKVSV